MKSLLPILKTKLFLLGFVSACTVILATTVPQIKNFIAPTKTTEEKIVAENKIGKKKISKKINISKEASTNATVVSDKPDYAPVSTAIFTGDGFGAIEEVVLKVKNLNQPCNTVSADSSYLSWTVTTDADGHFETNWTVCNCPGDSLRLRAVGQNSHDTAYAYFTDAPPAEPHKIIIGTINNNATSFCGSSALTMTFCADGVYAPKTGTTGLINTFRLRVTNPGGGSFDNSAAQDLVISSITQTSQVGSITCYTLTSTFPSIGTGSDNYRIRIDAWNPATIGDEYSYGGETLFEIIAPPTAEAGSNTTTCYGTLVNITAGSSTTQSTLATWTSNGDGVVANANSLTLATYTPGANDIIAGSVTITLTAKGNTPCGDATDTKTLTIIKTPAPEVGPQFFCAGSPTVANLLSGGGLFKWYLALTGGSALTSNTSISTRSYFVSTTANGCESPRTEVSVTITANASAGTVSPGTTPQCVGSSTTYTVSGQDLGGGTGGWSSSDAAIATVNASTGSVTAVSPGTVNIIYTVTGGCGGIKTAQASYTVYPAAPVLTAPANVCNTMFSLPSVTPLAGYDVQYNIDGGGWAANPSVTTPGCHTVKARYVLTGTSTAGPAGCNESNTVSVVIFPAKPSAPVVSNTCNAALTIPALVDVAGFTRQYSFNGGSTWGTSNTSSTTPGCYTMKSKYVLTGACGTNNAAGIDAPCGTSDAGNAVIFPAKPTLAPILLTCNTALASITAVTPVAGFTAEYAVKTPNGGGIYGAFGTLAAANTSLTNTPGCWSVKARYKLTDACGATAANATSTDACGESTEVNAVVFPAPPIITAPANTCNAAFNLPTVTPVVGFTTEFNINFSGWSATPTVPTTPGCYTIYARYVLTQTCGSTLAGSDGPLFLDEEDEPIPVIGGCTVSQPVNVVIFPAAPSAPVVTNTCNAALSIPALSVVSGFTAQYSFDNGTNWGVSNTSASTTPGCYNMKTRYVLASPCGSNIAGAPAACAASATGNAVIFPAAPSAPVVTNTCNAALTIPALSVVSGFTAQYSFDNGTNWGVSNTSASTTPGCFNMKTRYVLTNACGTNIAGTSAPAACAASATGNAVIFPAKPSAPVVSNTCNAALTIPALTDVTGFTRQYSFDGSTWGTSNTSSTTPGCYTLKSRYILSGACGTISANTEAPCGASDATNAVIFPAKPSAPVVSNSCNAALTIPALAYVHGFTRQYSFDGTTWGTINTSSSTTPGCYTLMSRYILTDACGTVSASTVAPCGSSDATNAVIFPAAPTVTAISNTCNTKLADITAVTTVTGFTAEYAVKAPVGSYSSFGTLTTANGLLTNTPGCWSVKARYKLTAACLPTTADATSTGACGESAEVNAVVFPSAPAPPTVNAACGPISVTAPASVTGFNIEYSFYDGAAGTWGANTPPTADNCAGYKIKTRYVLASTCGGTTAGTAGSGTCAASAATIRTVDNTAPSLTGTAYTGTTGTNACKANAETAAPFNAANAKQGYSDICSGTTVTAIKTGCTVTGNDCGWTATYTFKVVDGCGNEFPGQTYSNTGSDQTAPNVISKNISVTIGTGGSVTIVAADVNNGSNDGCDANVSLALDKYTFTDAEVGTASCSKVFTVKLTATDDCSNAATSSATVTVGRRPTSLTNSGVTSGQYSDPVNVKALLKDITDGGAIALPDKSVSFAIGSQTASDNYGGSGGGTDATGEASASITLNQSPIPTNYKVGSTFAGDNVYCASSDLDDFDITPEDACGSYNGTLFANSSSPTGGTATVRFKVVVTELADGSLGDVRNATVKFTVRDAYTNAEVTGSPFTATLDGTSTATQAIFYYDYTVTLTTSQLCKTFDVSWTVGGYYTNATCLEQSTQVTVAAPADDFSAGGGYIVLTNNAYGPIAGGAGIATGKNNWGYNVKWNKSLTNLQGNFNTIIRKNGRTYQVKSNKPTFLKITLVAAATSTTPAKRKAEITYGNATLKDVTDIVNGVCTAPGGVCWGDGNGIIYLTVEDNGEPGSTGSILDKIGFAVKDKNNSLWYSTNTWTNSTSSIFLQNIDGGNIQIRQASSGATVSNQTVSTDITTDITPTVLPFDVKAFPNPSQHVFSLVLENATNEKVQITVYDALGRQVKMFEKQSGNIPIHFGMDLKVGVYIVEVKQGDNRKTLKLVKQ